MDGNAELQKFENWLKAVTHIDDAINLEYNKINQSFVAIENLEKEKEYLLSIISLIEDSTSKQLMYRKFILGQTWEKVAEEMHYENANVFRLRKKAIREAFEIKNSIKKKDDSK